MIKAILVWRRLDIGRATHPELLVRVRLARRLSQERHEIDALGLGLERGHHARGLLHLVRGCDGKKGEGRGREGGILYVIEGVQIASEGGARRVAARADGDPHAPRRRRDRRSSATKIEIASRGERHAGTIDARSRVWSWKIFQRSTVHGRQQIVKNLKPSSY